jgi:hypothetical protein
LISQFVNGSIADTPVRILYSNPCKCGLVGQSRNSILAYLTVIIFNSNSGKSGLIMDAADAIIYKQEPVWYALDVTYDISS